MSDDTKPGHQLSERELLIRIDERQRAATDRLNALQCTTHQDRLTSLEASGKTQRWWMAVVFAGVPAAVTGVWFLLRAVAR